MKYNYKQIIVASLAMVTLSTTGALASGLVLDTVVKADSPVVTQNNKKEEFLAWFNENADLLHSKKPNKLGTSEIKRATAFDNKIKEYAKQGAISNEVADLLVDYKPLADKHSLVKLIKDGSVLEKSDSEQKQIIGDYKKGLMAARKVVDVFYIRKDSAPKDQRDNWNVYSKESEAKLIEAIDGLSKTPQAADFSTQLEKLKQMKNDPEFSKIVQMIFAEIQGMAKKPKTISAIYSISERVFDKVVKERQAKDEERAKKEQEFKKNSQPTGEAKDIVKTFTIPGNTDRQDNPLRLNIEKVMADKADIIAKKDSVKAEDVLMVFDITVVDQKGKNYTDFGKNEVSFSLKITDKTMLELLANNQVELWHIHGKEVTKVGFDFEEADQTITIKSAKFSQFAFVKKAQTQNLMPQVETKTQAKKQTLKAPNTGYSLKSIGLCLPVAVISALVAIVVEIRRR